MSDNILIVDDEDEMLSFLGELVSKSGSYSVTTAGNGEQALRELEQGDFEIILADFKMPGFGGLELLRAVKERLDQIEVIVTAEPADFREARACLREGAFDIVYKPFDADDVQMSLLRAVQRRRLLSASMLHRAVQAILQTQEPEQLPKVIVEMARQALACDEVALLLPGAQGKLFVAHASSSNFQPGRHIELAECVVRCWSENPSPALFTPSERDFRFADLSDLSSINSSIVYPLISGERLVGVLNLHRTSGMQPFRQSDLEQAAVLTAQARVAIESVRRVRQASGTDRLTAVGQVTAGIAHEISNPLFLVLSNLEFARRALGPLLSNPGAEEVRHALHEAEQGAQKINALVRDMRSLSKVKPEKVAFDLNDAVRSAGRIAGPRIRGSAQLELHLGEQVQVSGSVGQLSQVLINLLTNAAQAMSGQDRDRGKISVVTRREGDQVLALVSDTGVGIDPEKLLRIFEPLFSTKGPETKAGLDLCVCREILRSHQGELEVESIPGNGSTFILKLPSVQPKPTSRMAAQRKQVSRSF